jgi:hypothetical protein
MLVEKWFGESIISTKMMTRMGTITFPDLDVSLLSLSLSLCFVVTTHSDECLFYNTNKYPLSVPNTIRQTINHHSSLSLDMGQTITTSLYKPIYGHANANASEGKLPSFGTFKWLKWDISMHFSVTNQPLKTI